MLNTTEKEQAEKELEALYNQSCSYIARFKDPWNHAIYFSPQANIRLGFILGHIIGLYQAGGEDAESMAINMLHSFKSKLNNLCRNREKTEIEVISGKETVKVKVPAVKVLLHDDGTFHNFTFVTLYPSSKLNDTKSQAFAFGINDWDNQITEEVYVPNGPNVKVPYVEGYNGGLIYHGPGGGPNFTVSLTNQLWSINT